MPRSWLGSCRMCVQLDAPIPFAQRAWLGCCACAWGRGSWGVRPNCRSVEAGPTARVSGIRQDSDLGLRLSAHRPGSTTRAGNTSLQDWRPAVPGWLLLCPFLGVGTIPATTLGEWTPASQSQQEEGPKDKLRGGLSWGHSGSSMAGGRAGRRAGRQFGEGVFGAWQTQGLIAGASPGLTLAPALELQVGMLRQARAPPLQFSLGHSPPPTRFQSFGQGSCGWLRSLTQPPWAPRRHRLGKWDRSGWPSTTCQHTWHGTRGCRGGLGAAAAPQSH